MWFYISVQSPTSSNRTTALLRFVFSTLLHTKPRCSAHICVGNLFPGEGPHQSSGWTLSSWLWVPRQSLFNLITLFWTQQQSSKLSPAHAETQGSLCIPKSPVRIFEQIPARFSQCPKPLTLCGWKSILGKDAELVHAQWVSFPRLVKLIGL